MTKPRIALVGDYSPDVTAHVAIPKALEIASAGTGCQTTSEWIATAVLPDRAAEVLHDFDALWCIPASPYESMDGALEAIGYARTKHMPFLGTCGGYQHAVLEFARTVLGHSDADNAEVNQGAQMPLIGPLACALVEETGQINFTAGSHIKDIHNTAGVEEKYHCSYGIAPQYLGLFDGSALEFTGFDLQGEPRAFELKAHPFFIGTAYQPERSALAGQSHPLIEAFVNAAASKLSLIA